MAIQLFGFTLGRKEEEIKKAKEVPSFVPPENRDAAIEVAGNSYGTFIDIEGAAKTEADLINKYREMSMQPECEQAITDICNEAIVVDKRSSPVEINLDELEQPEKIKKIIREEFEFLSEKLDLSNMAYEIFKRWYVDGRLYYHLMVDTKSPREGIQELRYIDPRKIRKIREPVKNKPAEDPQNSAKTVPAYNEFYLYNPMGMTNSTTTQGLKIAIDSICYVHSGILDQKNKLILSNLHKALKPLNQLRMLEDAVVIYRLARAPERRIFYIDVGNLPKQKAEQYLKDMMIKHKNRLVYDASTGEVRDDRKFMTMLEDYWLPRREGGKGTEITTLPGGQNLGEMEDVEYFKRKLYKALNVPVSRLESDSVFNIGRSSEITRDELKFTKYVARLRLRFSLLFDQLLEIHLSLKGVMTREEFKEMKNSISYDFLEDNHFTELKDQELMNSRLSILSQLEPYVGKYFSDEWVQKKVLRMTDDEIEEIKQQMKDETPVVVDQPEDGMEDQIGQEPSVQPIPEKKPAAKPKAKAKPKRESIEINDPEFEELTEEEKRLVNSMSKYLDTLSGDKYGLPVNSMSRLMESMTESNKRHLED